jgi:toxin-antitoxin system PIN domain toxin
VTLLDANILLYAYNSDAPEQAAAAAWLDELLASGETIGLPWITVWAFLRIGTSPRIWPTPLAPERAFAIIEAWLDQPGVVPVGPGPHHGEILKRLVTGHRGTTPGDGRSSGRPCRGVRSHIGIDRSGFQAVSGCALGQSFRCKLDWIALSVNRLGVNRPGVSSAGQDTASRNRIPLRRCRHQSGAA